MANLTADFSQFILFIGVLAFVVSVITEALKKWEWFDKKVPTARVMPGSNAWHDAVPEAAY